MRIIVLLLSLIAFPVFADQSAQLTWQPPTTRTDGSALPAGDITGYRLFVAVDSQIPAAEDAHVLLLTGTSATYTLTLAPRLEPYVVRFALRAQDKFGLVSGLSNVASKTFRVSPDSEPGVPTSLTITISGGNITIEED